MGLEEAHRHMQREAASVAGGVQSLLSDVEKAGRDAVSAVHSHQSLARAAVEHNAAIARLEQQVWRFHPPFTL